MKFELKMPDLSTTGSPIKVVHWLVAIGDVVERGQAVLEVETDKATMEVEAINNGKLLEMIVAAGQEANAGEVLAIIGTEESSAPTALEAGRPLQTQTPKKYDRDFLLGLYERMVLIRQF